MCVDDTAAVTQHRAGRIGRPGIGIRRLIIFAITENVVLTVLMDSPPRNFHQPSPPAAGSPAGLQVGVKGNNQIADTKAQSWPIAMTGCNYD